MLPHHLSIPSAPYTRFETLFLGRVRINPVAALLSWRTTRAPTMSNWTGRGSLDATASEEETSRRLSFFSTLLAATNMQRNAMYASRDDPG